MACSDSKPRISRRAHIKPFFAGKREKALAESNLEKAIAENKLPRKALFYSRKVLGEFKENFQKSVKNVAKKAQEEEKKQVDIFGSDLVPKHEIMSGEERAGLLETLNISLRQLPRIREEDPVVKVLGAKKGDVLRITRKSHAGADYYYYRVVI